MKAAALYLAVAVVAAHKPCTVGDAAVADARRQLLDNGWKFSLAESSNAIAAAFDDTAWRTDGLPHDWSDGLQKAETIISVK